MVSSQPQNIGSRGGGCISTRRLTLQCDARINIRCGACVRPSTRRSSAVACGLWRSRAVVCGRVRSCAVACGLPRSRMSLRRGVSCPSGGIFTYLFRGLVDYCAVRCGRVRFSAVPCGRVWSSVVVCGPVRSCAVPCGRSRSCAVVRDLVR